jgi:hypothetical protein
VPTEAGNEGGHAASTRLDAVVVTVTAPVAPVTVTAAVVPEPVVPAAVTVTAAFVTVTVVGLDRGHGTRDGCLGGDRGDDARHGHCGYRSHQGVTHQLHFSSIAVEATPARRPR